MEHPSTTTGPSVPDMNLNSFYLLKDSMEAAQQNTSAMLWRLQQFEHRLSNLDEKMRPIQKTTTTLSTTKRNVGLTFLEIEKTHEYFQLAKENSAVIASGFKQESVIDFFEAIERITVAKRFFDDHREMKSSHSAMINIDNMIKRAMLHCVEEMNRIYRSCGNTFEEDSEGSFLVINPVSDGNLQWVKTICDCLEAHQVTTHLPMYCDQRITIIKSSLKRYEGSASNKQNNSLNSKSSPSALLELIKDGTILYTKGNLFFPRYMEAALTILRGETLLFSKVLPNSTPQSEKIFCTICLCVIEELKATIAPFIGENALDNVASGNGSGHGSSSNGGGSGLLSNSFSMKKSDKNVDSKPVILQRKSNLFLIHLDILDTFLANFFDLRNLSTPDDLKDRVLAIPLSNLLDDQRSSIVRSCLLGLEHLLQAIRMTNTTSAISSPNQHNTSGSPSKTPISTDLHPISGYVLCFCKEVVEFETVYQAMLRIAEELQFKTDYLPASTVSLESFMIDGLMSRLQERTKGTVFHLHSNAGANQGEGQLTTASNNNKPEANLFDPTIRMEELENAKIYLFLMNNLDVIASHIRGRLDTLQGENVPGSPGKKTRKSTYRGTVTLNLHTSVDDTPITVLSNQYNSVDSRIQNAVNALCNVISTILLTCINLDAAAETAEHRSTKSFKMSQSLLDKQLKTCFGAFNDTVDLLLSLKAQWRISSTDLRERVQGQLNLEIMESYTNFFEKYSSVNFSKKNKDSYLRYPPSKVEVVLSEFFG